MKLYVETVAVVGEELYFTTINTSCLFRILKQEIEEVTYFYAKEIPVRKVTEIRVIGDELWLVPNCLDHLWIYNMKTRQINQHLLPQQFIKGDGWAQFRKALLINDRVFMFSPKINDLLVVDIKTKKMETISLGVNGSIKDCFFANDRIYIIMSDACDSCIYGIKTAQIERWNTPEDYSFAALQNGCIFWAPASEKNIIETDMNCVIEREIAIPNRYFGKASPYQFWKPRLMNDESIVFLPHNAGVLAIYKNDKTTFVPTSEWALESLVSWDEHTIYDVMNWKDGILLVPCLGDRLWRLDKEYNVSELHVLEVKELKKYNELDLFINYEVLNDENYE